MYQKEFWIGGKQNINSVIDQSICKEVLIDQNRKDLDKYKNKKKIKFVSKKIIDKKFFEFKNYNHQGFAALINYNKIISIEEFFNIKSNENILAIDTVQDIGNFGTIIRSCVAFGISTILINHNNFTKKLSLIFKNSAGSFKDINIIYTSNIFNELKKFNKNNYTITSLDSQGKSIMSNFNWSEKNLIIIGSEEKGIKKNILKKSEFVVKINTTNKTESLNVAQACSIAMYDLYSKKS